MNRAGRIEKEDMEGTEGGCEDQEVGQAERKKGRMSRRRENAAGSVAMRRARKSTRTTAEPVWNRRVIGAIQNAASALIGWELRVAAGPLFGATPLVGCGKAHDLNA